MIFLSAGHNPLFSVSTRRIDPGAIGCGYRESYLTTVQRDLVASQLSEMKLHYIIDRDYESLGEYLKRIKTGSGSVVLEFHFDAANSPSATGTTAIIGRDSDRLDRAFAKALVDITASVVGLKNRGVITEDQSHRGSLGLMREQGIVCLLEICFITNCNDVQRWRYKRFELAKEYARIIAEYEKLI